MGIGTILSIALHIGSIVPLVKDGETLEKDVVAGKFNPADVISVCKDLIALAGVISLPAAAGQDVVAILNGFITVLSAV